MESDCLAVGFRTGSRSQQLALIYHRVNHTECVHKSSRAIISGRTLEFLPCFSLQMLHRKSATWSYSEHIAVTNIINKKRTTHTLGIPSHPSRPGSVSGRLARRTECFYPGLYKPDSWNAKVHQILFNQMKSHY